MCLLTKVSKVQCLVSLPVYARVFTFVSALLGDKKLVNRTLAKKKIMVVKQLVGHPAIAGFHS